MREFLKGLGLDQETIDSIMAEHGKLMTANTEKISELTQKVSGLTEENTALKKVDAKALQDQIDSLTQQNTDLVTNHKNEIDNMKFDNALEMAVIKSKTIDPVALKAHLDRTKLTYNEESKGIDGFDDQLAALKESHRYLFQEPAANGSRQGDFGNGSNTNQSLSSALTEHYKE